MADQEYRYDATPTLDEMVFEGRNKEYGAYDLRNTSKKALLRSFLIGTGLFLLMILIPIVYLRIQQMNAADKFEGKANLVEIVEEDPIIEEPEKPKEPEPEPPKVEEKIEIIQNVVPEPRKAPVKEVPPPPVSVAKETNVGVTPQEGVRMPTVRPAEPPKIPGTGTKTATAETKPTIDPNAIQTTVDQEAEFPSGGVNGFRQRVQEDFDASVIEGADGIISGMITFVVEKDGSLTQVSVNSPNKDFNREAERTVRGIKAKWKPAKINGQPVRSRFKLPIKMQPPE